ncbi:MAG TPA: hypothetical protein ACFYD3_09160 [Candidatus Hypogeohydataceae bacterium YC41]
MYKKFLVAVGIFVALTLAGMPSLTTYRLLAHEHEHNHGCCDHCGHYVCPGDCGKCEECLAKQRAQKAAKCEKCGHEECPGNCKKCVECLTERIEKLEKEKEGENKREND